MKILRYLLRVLAILAVSVRPGVAQPTVQAPVANEAIFAVDESPPAPAQSTILTNTLTGTDPNNASFTFSLSTPPAHGTVTVQSNGSFTYTLDPEYIGNDSFGFKANNGSLYSAEATIDIIVIPGSDPPAANPVYASVSTNTVLYGQLLGSDINDDAVLTYSYFPPQHGTVTAFNSKSGQFTYQPASTANNGDIDSFAYNVSDDKGQTNSSTVTITIGSDSVGFIADTVIANVEGADLVNLPAYSPPTAVSGPAVDEAVDRANQRLYVLTADTLNVYDITSTLGANGITSTTGGIMPTTPVNTVQLSPPAEHIALSLDGRTAYIGSPGKVTAVNLYPEDVPSLGYRPAYTYWRDYTFPPDVPEGRDVAAMGVHPAGDRLYVVIDMDPAFKSLNINNDLLVSDIGNGTTAMQALAAAPLTDYGFLTYLDISADLGISRPNQLPARFVTALNLMGPSNNPLKSLAHGAPVIGVRKIAFSPDGNYALICGVGAQTPRVTPFGVIPTSDLGTGGTLVVDVRRYTDQNMSIPPTAMPTDPSLCFIPDEEHGENTSQLRQQIIQKSFTIVHPEVQAAGIELNVATAGVDVSLGFVAGTGSIGTLPVEAMEFEAAAYDYDLLWKSYQDYGAMQAYFDLYPRDMVGASSVAINHTGDFGVVTMEDTNNLGLLQLSLTTALSGYSNSPGNLPVDGQGNPIFYIARGTGKTINGFDAALTDAAPTKTIWEWAFPQTVAFTSDDSRIFIGLGNGGPRSDNSNRFGTSDALALRTQRANAFFLSASPPPGYDLAGAGGFESPRLATTLQSFDSSHDSLSDQLKAYNRWNSLRPLSQIDPQNLTKKASTDPAYLTVAQCLAKIVSTDPSYLTVPGTVLPSNPNIPDSLNVGFYLPPSGIGYRLNTFGMPADTTNLATRGVVTALVQMGLNWNQYYHHPGTQPSKMPTITRPYFVVGLLSQAGGGIILNQNGEPLNLAPVTGNEADFPYFKVNSDGTLSDEAFNFVPSAGPANPTDNTGETRVGFDEPNTEALIRLLLLDQDVTKIELDPYPLSLLPPDVQSDLRLFAHGLHFTNPAITNTSRRDLSDHMHVTFRYLHVGLSIDANNTGVITNSPAQVAAKNQVNSSGKLVSANIGFIGDPTNQAIPDYADGYDIYGNSKPNASAGFVPMIIRFPDDIPLANMQFSLTYDESDPSLVTQDPNSAYVNATQTPNVPQYLYDLPPTGGSFRIWTKDGPQARLKADIPSGNFIASGKLYNVTDLLAIDPANKGTDRSVTVYIEAVKVGAPAGNVVVNVITNTGPQSSVSTMTDAVRIAGQYVGFVVDANRDGVITLPSVNSSDAVTTNSPFRHWINDGFDGDPSGVTHDYMQTSVISAANVATNFFPVFLNIQSVVSQFPPGPGSGVTYSLTQGDKALSFVDTSTLNANPNYTELTRETAFAYQTKGSDSANPYPNSKIYEGLPLIPIKDAVTTQAQLSDHILNEILANGDQGVLLMEGTAATTKPLVLTVAKNGVTVAQITLPLSLGNDIVLLLHGMNSNVFTWDTFIKQVSGTTALFGSASIIDGVIATTQPPVRTAGGLRLYRLQAGDNEAAGYPTNSGLEGLNVSNALGQNPASTEPTPYLQSPVVTCGDFETFAELGGEVDEAVQVIKNFDINNAWNDRIVLVGHSRGGLSARVFLENPSFATEQAVVVGLLTDSSPQQGSRMGEIWSYLDTPANFRHVYFPGGLEIFTIIPPWIGPGSLGDLRHPAGGIYPLNWENWDTVDFLMQTTVLTGTPLEQAKSFLDIRRPVIHDMADNSAEMTNLNANANVAQLPITSTPQPPNSSTPQQPNTMIYGEIVYEKANFGLLASGNPADSTLTGPGSFAYSVFGYFNGGNLTDIGLAHLDKNTEYFLTNNLSPSDSSLIGDGLIPARLQTYTTLPGFPSPTDPTKPNKIPRLVNQTVLSVHTDAPSRVNDLLQQLRQMEPGWFP